MKIVAYIDRNQKWAVDILTSKFGGSLDINEAKEMFHSLGVALKSVKKAEDAWSRREYVEMERKGIMGATRIC